jgi:hypothetical protein
VSRCQAGIEFRFQENVFRESVFAGLHIITHVSITLKAAKPQPPLLAVIPLIKILTVVVYIGFQASVAISNSAALSALPFRTNKKSSLLSQLLHLLAIRG